MNKIQLIKFGICGEDGFLFDHSEVLDYLNKINIYKVDYRIIELGDLISMTDEELISYMRSLFDQWNVDFELDGIVIDINDKAIRKSLGRYKNGDVRYSVKFKGHFEDVATTCVNGLEYQISKQGYLKPVILIDPVRLNGVTVSRVSGYNFKNIVDNNIGQGAIVSVKRSGSVIPKIIEVHNNGIVTIPEICPDCLNKLAWNESGVELMCTNDKCPGKMFKKALSFFRVIGTANVEEGTLRKFFISGYDSVYKILKMSQDEMSRIDGFGYKKARKIIISIQESISEISLEKFQHASGCFDGIGEETFKMINEAMDADIQLADIPGIGEKTISDFFAGCAEFYDVARKLSMVTIKTQVIEPTGSMVGFVVVMTGFRDKELKSLIESEGGKVAEGLTRATTHLLSNDVGSGSRKEDTALKYGIPVLTKEEFIESLDE